MNIRRVAMRVAGVENVPDQASPSGLRTWEVSYELSTTGKIRIQAVDENDANEKINALMPENVLSQILTPEDIRNQVPTDSWDLNIMGEEEVT